MRASASLLLCLLVGLATAGCGSSPSSAPYAIDMATGGPALPLLQLTGIGVTVGGLAFNPTPANLPLRH